MLGFQAFLLDLHGTCRSSSIAISDTSCALVHRSNRIQHRHLFTHARVLLLHHLSELSLFSLYISSADCHLLFLGLYKLTNRSAIHPFGHLFIFLIMTSFQFISTAWTFIYSRVKLGAGVCRVCLSITVVVDIINNNNNNTHASLIQSITHHINPTLVFTKLPL